MASELAQRAGKSLLRLVAGELEATPRRIVGPTAAELQKYSRQARSVERKWEREFGEPYPATLDDLRRQASRAGVSFGEFERASEAEIFAWVEGYFLRRRDKRAEAQPFVPSPIQEKILKALEGVALKTHALAAACNVENSRLYKPHGIKELRAAGLVALKHGLGNYRPDAPPPGARGKK
jgi:hypothetical protein